MRPGDLEYVRVFIIRIDQLIQEYKVGSGCKDAENFMLFFRRLAELLNEYHPTNWVNLAHYFRTYPWFSEHYMPILLTYPNGDRTVPPRLDNAPLAVQVVSVTDAQLTDEQTVPFIRIEQKNELGSLSIVAPNIGVLREAAAVVQETDNNRTENRMLIQNNEMSILDKQLELARLQSPARVESSVNDKDEVPSLISPAATKKRVYNTRSSSRGKKMKRASSAWESLDR